MSASSPPRRSAVPPLEVATTDVRSEITLGATFVCQDTVVAVVSLNHLIVCTAELGGWVRKREVSSGQVTQQCRLRSSQDPTTVCICGDRLWVGQSEGLITVLSISALQPLADCSLHQQGITTIRRFGEVVVSACADGCFACWDSTNFKCSSCIPVRRNGAINFCLPLSQGLLVNTDTYEVALLDWEKFEVIRAYQGHEQDVLSAAVCDGVLWTGGHDYSVRLFDVAEGRLLRTLHVHTAPVHAIYRSPAGDRTWSASMDGRVVLWDVASVEPLGELPLSYPKGPTKHFVFCIAPVASTLVWKVWTCATDGVVKCWLSQSDEEPRASQLIERVQTLEAEAAALVLRAPFTEDQLTTFMREKGREFELEKSLLFSEINQLLILGEDATGRFRIALEESYDGFALFADMWQVCILEAKRSDEARKGAIYRLECDAALQLVTIRSLEHSVGTSHSKILELELDRGKMLADLSKLEHALSVTEDRLLLQSAKSERYLAELDELRMQINGLHHQAREHEDQSLGLKAQVDKLQALCSDESQRVVTKERKIVTLESDNAEMKSAIAALRRELRQKNEESFPQRIEVDVENKNLTRLLEEARAVILEKEQEMLRLSAQHLEDKKHVQSDISKAQSVLATTQAELENQRRCSEELSRELAMVQVARNSVESKAIKLEEDLNVSNMKRAELANAMKLAESQNTSLTQELDHLKIDLERRRQVDTDIIARAHNQFDETLKQQYLKVSQMLQEISRRDEELIAIRNANQLLEARIRSESATLGEERFLKEAAEKQLASLRYSREQLVLENESHSKKQEDALSTAKAEIAHLNTKLSGAADELKNSRSELLLMHTREVSLVEHITKLQALETDSQTSAVELHRLTEQHVTSANENAQLRAELDATVKLLEAREEEHASLHLSARESAKSMLSRIGELESLVRMERMRIVVLEKSVEAAKPAELALNEAQTKASTASHMLQEAESRIRDLELVCQRADVDAAASRRLLQEFEGKLVDAQKESEVVRAVLKSLEAAVAVERQDWSAKREEAAVAKQAFEKSVQTLTEEIDLLKARLMQANEHSDALKGTMTNSFEREERIFAVTAERESLSREVGELRRSLQKAEDASKAVQEQLLLTSATDKLKQSKINELEQRMVDERSICTQIQSELTAEIAQLQEELSEAQRKQDTSVAQLNLAAQQASARLAEIEDDRDMMKRLLDEAYCSIIESNKEVSRLQEEHGVLNTLVTELQDDLNETKRALHSCFEARTVESDELASRSTTIELCQQELRQVRDHNARLDDHTKLLTTQLLEEREAHLLCKEQSTRANAELGRELDCLRADRDRLSHEMKDMSKKVADATSTFKQQDDALNHAMASLRLQQEEAELLRHKLAVAGDEVRTLKAMNSYKDEIIAQVASDANREYLVFST